MSGRIATCKSPDCRGPLLWRLNPATGKRVPLDADPVSSDDRFVVKRAFHYRIDDDQTCHVATMAEWADDAIPLHCSHFRTCRSVDMWSKKHPNGAAVSRPNTSADDPAAAEARR